MAFLLRPDESAEAVLEVEAEAFSICFVSFSISFFNLLLSLLGFTNYRSLTGPESLYRPEL